MSIPFRQYWALLSRYLRPQLFRALLLAVSLAGFIGLQLLGPQVLRSFIDTATAQGRPATLSLIALLYIGVAFAAQGLSMLNVYIGELVAWAATNALRLDLARHCLYLDQSFHKTYTPGELVERTDGDVHVLASFFSQLFIDVSANLLLVVGVLALLFREDWRVGVSLSLFALAGLGVLGRIRSVAVPYWEQVRQTVSTFFGFLGEVLTAAEDVRANGAESYVMRRFHEITRRWLRFGLKAGVASSSMWMANIGIFALGNAIAFGVSAYLWRAEAITIGTVFLIFRYTDLLRQPMEQIRNRIAELQQADASIHRVQQLLGQHSKLGAGSGEPLPPGPLSVACRDVSFSYDEQGAVLHHLSFELEPGRVLGLLGRTGSGKTTVARLLLRLYDPDNGEVQLGGVTLTEAGIGSIRERVGLVTQEVQLLNATVRDNLTFYNPAVPDKQLLAVLDDLGLSEWLRALPAGLDTVLAPGGSLSAGQAQLLAFGRVFLADPGLVVLDEASSRLDPATERMIERATDRLLAGRTGVIIAHHLATLQRTDDILILENGRVLERGPRAALAGDPTSHFHRLLQTGLEEVLA